MNPSQIKIKVYNLLQAFCLEAGYCPVKPSKVKLGRFDDYLAWKYEGFMILPYKGHEPMFPAFNAFMIHGLNMEVFEGRTVTILKVPSDVKLGGYGRLYNRIYYKGHSLLLMERDLEVGDTLDFGGWILQMTEEGLVVDHVYYEDEDLYEVPRKVYKSNWPNMKLLKKTIRDMVNDEEFQPYFLKKKGAGEELMN